MQLFHPLYLPPLEGALVPEDDKRGMRGNHKSCKKKGLKSISNLSTHVFVITEEVMRLTADTYQVTSL